jgi:capsular polysaccharide export protein
VYNIRGITHQGLLDDFWTNPTPPDPEVFEAFCRVLRARYLVRGGLSSMSAVGSLVETITKRLLTDFDETNLVSAGQLQTVSPTKWRANNQSG